MAFVSNQCKAALRNLAYRDTLSAMEKSLLDLHLRRCDRCARVAADFDSIQVAEAPRPALSLEFRQSVYDRLVPSVHEISVEMQNSRSRQFRWQWVAFPGAAVLSATLLLILLGGLSRPVPQTIDPSLNASLNVPGNSISPRSPAMPAVPTVNEARLDRIQGIVSVNGQNPAALGGILPLARDTRIEVEEGGVMDFRVGDLARVALMDTSVWSIHHISETRIAFFLSRGKMAVSFDSSFGRVLDVVTPESLVRVKGTIFTVEVCEDGVTRVSVARGVVDVTPLGGQQVSLEAGRMMQVPGDGRHMDIGDRQRLLVSEVEPMSETPVVTSSGRMVSFNGNQEHVKVEIDGISAGYTPLTLRLPLGTVSYRLSKPGMRPVEAILQNEQIEEHVRFLMTPEDSYEPAVTQNAQLSRRRRISRTMATETEQDREVRDYMIRARAAMQAGNLPFAANLLEKTIPLVNDAELVTATSLLAECYSAMGQYRSAADLFDRVASLVPDTAVGQNARYEVGRLAMNHIGDFDRARNAFTAYMASPVGGQLQEDAYYALCELYGRDGRRKSAVGCFNDYLRMFPEGHRTAHARLWRGVLLQESSQNWKAAEVDLLAFVTMRPNHPRCEEARYRIALGRYHTSDFPRAMQMISEYMREHPNGQYRIRLERLRDSIQERILKSARSSRP